MTLRRAADGRILLPGPPMTGGCQCGRHRDAIDRVPLTLYGRHRRARQRQRASAFGMSMAIARAALRAVLGTVARASDSGRAVVGRVCPDCGTHLFHEPAHSPETVDVKPGTLDDTGWLVPVGWPWTALAQPSFRPDPDALLREGQPADMEARRARFRAVYAVPARVPARSVVCQPRADFARAPRGLRRRASDRAEGAPAGAAAAVRSPGRGGRSRAATTGTARSTR